MLLSPKFAQLQIEKTRYRQNGCKAVTEKAEGLVQRKIQIYPVTDMVDSDEGFFSVTANKESRQRKPHMKAHG